jgi:hypothetical protein
MAFSGPQEEKGALMAYKTATNEEPRERNLEPQDWIGYQVPGPGELVSLLYGPCREVELVALDPMSDVETDVMNRLVSLERGRFVDVLLRS